MYRVAGHSKIIQYARKCFNENLQPVPFSRSTHAVAGDDRGSAQQELTSQQESLNTQDQSGIRLTLCI